ncbi:MAG: acetate--CoA ligase [Rhodospirillaceae bacterium]|nr:acetate--CoA ligase [Rhodospirillaceae bacterium]
MAKLTDFISHADAQAHFSKEALWDLFDGVSENLNIAHECLDRHPRGRCAVRIVQFDGPVVSHSFGEISDWSGRFANWLIGRGVAKGDRVAIMLEPSLAFYAALFGTMKAGAVAVPLFTAFGVDGLTARLKDSEPVLLILAPEKRGLAGTAGIDTIIADATMLSGIEVEDAGFKPKTASGDMAMYQYTSGTSREMPEAVKHRHRAVVTVIIAALYATGVRPGDRYMCPSSPAWGHGLWHGTVAPLALGVEIVSYAGKFDPVRLLDAIEEFEITNLSAAATHYRMMRISGDDAAARSFRLKKLSFTGEPLDTDTAEWAKQAFGHPVCSIYGTTEVGVIIASYPGAPDLPIKPGSLGRPLPGCDVAILDSSGKPCRTDEIGEIMLRRGDDWFPVKDLGRMDEDGYYFHHGRADDVIISAGWTMSAVEIEDVLLKHRDVEEAAAIGVANEERGQVVKVFIVSSRRGDDAFSKELQNFARDRLSRHEYPRIVDFVDDLPKTPAGKVNRKLLRDQEQKREAAS